MTKLRLFCNPFTWGFIALITYLIGLSPWVYPGSAATVLAHLSGAWQATAVHVTAHPLLSQILGSIGPLLPASKVVFLFNLFSAICGALSVTVFCQIVHRSVLYFADEPRTRPFAPTAALAAVPVAGLALILSPIFLRTATHFQWQTFDLFLALGATLLLLRVAQTSSKLHLTAAALLWGLLILEGTPYLLLTPFFVLALALAYYSNQDKLRLGPFVWNLALPMLIGLLLTFTLITIQTFSLTPDLSLQALLASQVYAHLGETLSYLKGPWILVVLTGILPGLLTLFLLRDAGNNRRTPTLFFTYLTTFVLTALALLPQELSILTLTQEWGECYPILPALFTAFSLAGLTAISILFAKIKTPPEAAEEKVFVRRICRYSGPFIIAASGLTLLISGVMVTVKDRLEQAPFTDVTRTYCDAVLAVNHAQAETWLLSDGIADVYLALRIAERQIPVTVFSLTQEQNPAAIKHLRQRLAQSSLFATKPELQATLDRALDIGLIPFIQDWIRLDADSTRTFMTLGLPDLWYTGNRLPLPNTWGYQGASNRTEQHAGLIPVTPGTFSQTAPDTPESLPEALRQFAQYVHRQRGFVANNTAFYLADAGKLDEAYILFEAVYAYDPDNVSALFNIFELVNGGLHPEKRTWCEQEVTALIKRMRGQRYRLWALARTYGYIRSPQLISMLAGSWAMSGQTGAALSGLDLALAMLDDGQKTALNKAIADLCMTDPSKRSEAISRYQQMLNTSTDRKQSLAYVRELVRMHILENDLEAAKRQLEQVDPTGVSPDLAYERALWFASAGQPERAQAELQICLEQNPKHQEAIAMLATLQLQANELETLATKTLPKLRTVSGTDDNYFVQIITAQLAERQNQLEKARAAYLRALALKPEVHALRTTVLTLDIRLNDKVAAARHAKQFLYQDRTLPLANYVMGSLALGEGDAKRALSYLQAATTTTGNTHPIPEAFNDLAEAHRQLGDWTAALAAAQHACKLSPQLAIARETAAAALLELGRYQEAHAALDEAFTIEKQVRPNTQPDPRLYLTRARLHEKEGLPDLARVDLAEIKKVYDTLDATAKAEFDALADRIHFR